MIRGSILSFDGSMANPALESEEVLHNMVAACRYQGMNAQEAFDHLDLMLQARYAAFEDATASIPLWGASVDAEVARYVDGLMNCVKANLYLIFRSHMYSGTDRYEVCRRREIAVLKVTVYIARR